MARARVEPLVRAFAPLKDIVVEVAETYRAVGDSLLSGACTIAWAPPIVCARVEMAGGDVVLRAVRGGSTTYRAGIVCRAGEKLDWSRAHEMVAAWVDEDSAAGYLLARSLLAARKIDAVRGFKRALFTGSYVSALQAVADGKADVTSVFVAADPPEGGRRHSTLDEIDEKQRVRLEICAITGETQTDGIVLAPGADRGALKPLLDMLAGLHTHDDGRAALKTLLQCEELRAPATRVTSVALRELLVWTSPTPDESGPALRAPARR